MKDLLQSIEADLLRGMRCDSTLHCLSAAKAHDEIRTQIVQAFTRI